MNKLVKIELNKEYGNTTQDAILRELGYTNIPANYVLNEKDFEKGKNKIYYTKNNKNYIFENMKHENGFVYYIELKEVV